jgi:hypothetical protein
MLIIFQQPSLAIIFYNENSKNVAVIYINLSF